MNKESQGLGHAIALPDLAATTALGVRIAASLERGSAVGLVGDLGAGKTTLARAILRAIGVRETVPSPSFTLVQNYETARFPVRHFDFYRIELPREIEELGLDEALAEGAALIEWPERAAGFLPEDMLRVELSFVNDDERRATLSGPAGWVAQIAGIGTDVR